MGPYLPPSAELDVSLQNFQGNHLNNGGGCRVGLEIREAEDHSRKNTNFLGLAAANQNLLGNSSDSSIKILLW